MEIKFTENEVCFQLKGCQLQTKTIDGATYRTFDLLEESAMEARSYLTDAISILSIYDRENLEKLVTESEIGKSIYKGEVASLF